MDNDSVSNTKKVIVALVFLGILMWVYTQKDTLLATTSEKAVAGVSIIKKQASQEKVALPQFDLQEKVQEISNEVSKLDVKDVAASSPQVQKVLKDMEALKNLPRSQAKDACVKICNGL